MGFGGGGGSSVITAHDHSNGAGQGGALDSTATLYDAVLLETKLAQEVVKLDTHVASTTESTYTYTPSSALDWDDYSSIIVVYNGKPTASLELRFKINAHVQWYFGNLLRMTGSTPTYANYANQAYHVIGTTTAFSTAGMCGMIELRGGGSEYESGHGWHQGNMQGSIERWSYTHQVASSTLTSFEIYTSTSTWLAGTTIDIYGVKKT